MKLGESEAERYLLPGRTDFQSKLKAQIPEPLFPVLRELVGEIMRIVSVYVPMFSVF